MMTILFMMLIGALIIIWLLCEVIISFILPLIGNILVLIAGIIIFKEVVKWFKEKKENKA